MEGLGRWWLPNKPGKVLSGVLSPDAERGWLLKLQGSFDAEILDTGATDMCGTTLQQFFVTGRPPDQAVILGNIGGRLVTLIDCPVLNLQLHWPSPAMGSMTIWPKILAYEVHFESLADFSLTSLSLRYSNLDSWTNNSGIEFTKQTSGATVKYTRPEPVEACIGDGLTLKLVFKEKISLESSEEVRILQSAWLEIRSLRPLPYEDLRKYADTFSDLVALAVGQPVRPLEMSGECSARAGEEDPLRPVSFGLVHNREPIAPVLPDRYPAEMLFALPDLRNDFVDIVTKWLNPSEAIQPLRTLYFGTLRSPGMYVEHRFLNMFQALESYHRRNCPSGKTDEHEERLRRIREGAGADWNWLKQKLRYSHEPAAADRIRALVETHRAERLLDVEAVAMAVHFRNFYTHYDRRLETKIPPREQRSLCLHNLAVRLKALCEMIVLEPLGIPDIGNRVEERLRSG